MAKLFLLVDDDNDDAELFSEALAGINTLVEFHHVQDGPSAFEFMNDSKNKKPDLIFLDLNMPLMSGWECLAKLKSDTHLRSIPVLMYSTSSYQRDKERAIELGAIGFITKPSEYKLLQKTLERIAFSLEDLKSVT
ncbi:MAG TPA: response regulator [Cyclobacteriaceae bacterium]